MKTLSLLRFEVGGHSSVSVYSPSSSSLHPRLRFSNCICWMCVDVLVRDHARVASLAGFPRSVVLSSSGFAALWLSGRERLCVGGNSHHV